MKDRAYCKVNLALDVLGVRDDGYHELKMIMVPLDFYDELEIVRSNETSYSCQRPNVYFDENNTIVKALNLMKSDFNIADNFSVSLNKYIPIKAGLAGGSSDGASVIRIINKMYHLNLSDGKIKELCLKIGSDVLFNYYNRPALVEGTGDKLTFIDIKDNYYVLLVKPRKGVSTKECYKLVDDNCVHPDVDLILDRLKNGGEITSLLANSLEKPAIELCKDIASAKRDLIEAGASFSMVSGSGSTVFTIDKNYHKIIELRDILRNKGYFVRSSQILK